MPKKTTAEPSPESAGGSAGPGEPLAALRRVGAGKLEEVLSQSDLTQAGWRTSGAGGAFMTTTRLTLYVTGRSPSSDRAVVNLRTICDELEGLEYELVVVDVLERPQLAEDECVLATPTVVKLLPLPLRRVIGDLSDKHKVLIGLDLRAPDDARGPGRREET